MQPVRTHDVVVEDSRGDSGGMGLGVMFGIILAVLLIVGLAWMFTTGRLGSSGPAVPATNNSNPSITVPNTTTINPPTYQVNPPAAPGTSQQPSGAQ